MSTRRGFLAGVAGTAAVAGLAGCLGATEEPEKEEPGADTIFPAEGPALDDDLLTAVADPSLQVPPASFSCYQYEVQALAPSYELSDAVPRVGGSLLGLIDAEFDEIATADLGHLTGSFYNATARSGAAFEVQPYPSGETVHLTGEFDATTFLDWLNENERYRETGQSEEFKTYIAPIQDDTGFETWGVRDGRVVIVSRTDVTSAIERYEAHEEAADDALAIEFDQIERDDAPIANSAPTVAKAVGALDDGPLRAGAGYAFIPLAANTGSAAFDSATDGVVGAGCQANLRQSAIQRSVAYLETEYVSKTSVDAAFSAAEAEEGISGPWRFDSEQRVVSARASLDSAPAISTIQTGFPAPGYGSVFDRVNPADVGRAATPKTTFRPEIDDGTLRISYVSGGSLESLRVRYVHDGEARVEDWGGPVSEGDQFQSAETIDGDTRAWIVWKPDTPDAAVVSRFQT